MNFELLDKELRDSRTYFKAVTPGIPGVFAHAPIGAGEIIIDAHKFVSSMFKARGVLRHFRKYRQHKMLSTTIGEHLGDKITGKLMSPVSNVVTAQLQKMPKIDHDIERRNGMGGRSWITEPGRYDMVIVFHNANRAGPHVDVHIDRLSVVYRVKAHDYAKLKYNREGYLTEDSQKLLINFVRAEIANGSRVPQNLDHSYANARCQWVNGGTDGTDYGAGPTRQIISESKVDIYKAHENGPIEFFAPVLNPHRGMYLYPLYPGDDKRAPILVWGNRSAAPPVLEDRLHLKLVQPESLATVSGKVDMSTTTGKYDGSSCYVVINQKGTSVWSPRQSVKTGSQIEYTHKLDGIATITSPTPVVGMGELLFYTKDNAWSKKQYLPCASGSGILNSNDVLPDGIHPEIRLYRIDKLGRDNVKNMDFWSNRRIQEQVAALDPKRLAVVDLMTPAQAMKRGFEGVVIVPESGSVNDGIKVKWCEDPNDWRIDAVDFHLGERGGIAGVVRCTSLESGKQFKLGPGQMGNQQLTKEMMAHPENYIGSVIKVNSKRGHEARAAKVIGFHQDKGLAVTDV